MSKTAEPAPPTLPDARMNLCKPNSPATGRIVRSERCTASPKAAGIVRHIEIDVSGTPLENACLPGQSIGVLAPGEDDRGRPHKVRLYSLASPSEGEDGHGRVLSTTVKRTIDEHRETGKLFLGVASNWLCDQSEGDEIKLTGPAGKRFLLPEDTRAHDYALFSTGTGIAPFRGFLLDLLSRDEDSRVTLVSGAAYATDLPYHDELTALAAKHPDRFRYLAAISREDNGGDGRLYVGDRLRTHAGHFAELFEAGRTLVYICGIAGMEHGVLKSLADLLGPERARAYFDADAETLASTEAWPARSVVRHAKPTARVMLEVYD